MSAEAIASKAEREKQKSRDENLRKVKERNLQKERDTDIERGRERETWARIAHETMYSKLKY